MTLLFILAFFLAWFLLGCAIAPPLCRFLARRDAELVAAMERHPAGGAR